MSRETKSSILTPSCVWSILRFILTIKQFTAWHSITHNTHKCHTLLCSWEKQIKPVIEWRDDVMIISVLFRDSSVPRWAERSARACPAEWRSRNVSPSPARPASRWSRRWGRSGVAPWPGSSAASSPARAVRRWAGRSAVQPSPAPPGAGRSPGSSSPSPADRSLASSARPQHSSAGQSSRRNVCPSVSQSSGAGNVGRPSQPPQYQPLPTLVSPLVSPLVSRCLQEYL